MHPNESDLPDAETPASAWGVSGIPAQHSPTASPHRLQGCAACGELMDISNIEPLTDWTCPKCRIVNTAEGRLGNYTLTVIAGRGGMGVVYRAWDESLGRWVAIKLLRRDQSSDPLTIKRLEDEAGITATINHPNVVRVFSTGRDGERFYIVMELVDQGALDDRIRQQGRLPEWEVLNVGIQAAKGLQAAQSAGLIHRDVKPGNILFGEDNSAKIVDFGLAIFQEEEEAARGEIWGTPYYVAPEKLESMPEDFRSDMYSLGGTLFHALAGRPPFEAQDASHVALKHLKSQPMSIQTFAPWVSNATAFIINRTLHKDPNERFQSYDELIENLQYAQEALLKEGNSQQAKSRVVVEDDKEQQAWGWVTLVALGIAVLGILVAAIFWKPLFGGKSRSEEVSAPVITSPWPAAGVDAWNAGRFEESAVQFRRSGETKGGSAAWNRMGQWLSLTLAGDADGASALLSDFGNAAPSGSASGQDAFFGELVSRLSRKTPIEPAELGGLNRTNYEAFALLAYGVQNLALGAAQPGVSLLREFRSCNVKGDDAWLANARTLTTNLIDHIVSIEMTTAKIAAEQNPGKRAAMLAELRNLPGLFTRHIEGLSASLPPVDPEALFQSNYRIVNRKNRRHLEVPANEHRIGGKIAISDALAGLAQHWALFPGPEGKWEITSRSGERSIIAPNAAGNEPTLGDKSKPGVIEYRWRLEPTTAGAYRIISVASGLALAASEEGSTVMMASITPPQPGMEWEFIRTDDVYGPWRYSEIGYAPGFAKVERSANGVIAFTAGGDKQWDRLADNCRFLWQRISGDCEIVARLRSISGGQPWIKTGLMIRRGLGGFDAHHSISMVKNTGYFTTYRVKAGGATGSLSLNEFKVPVWLRLQRRGSKTEASHSFDGTTWVSDTIQEWEAPEEVLLIGFSTSAANSESGPVAEFDQISIVDANGRSLKLDVPAVSLPTQPAQPGPTVATGPSLLKDAGFESFNDGPVPAPWAMDTKVKFQALVETAQQHSGLKSLWVEVPKGKSWVSVQQKVKVEPNAKYALSVWCRGSDPGGNRAAVLGMWAGSAKVEQRFFPASDWKREEMVFETGNATEVHIFVANQPNADAAGWVRLDDFELRKL